MNRSIDYKILKKQGTGSHDTSEETRTVIYPFGRYRIKVQLTSSNEFLGIEEVEVDKEFVSHKKNMSPAGFHDVEEFYPE